MAIDEVIDRETILDDFYTESDIAPRVLSYITNGLNRVALESGLNIVTAPIIFTSELDFTCSFNDRLRVDFHVTFPGFLDNFKSRLIQNVHLIYNDSSGNSENLRNLRRYLEMATILHSESPNQTTVRENVTRLNTDLPTIGEIEDRFMDYINLIQRTYVSMLVPLALQIPKPVSYDKEGNETWISDARQEFIKDLTSDEKAMIDEIVSAILVPCGEALAPSTGFNFDEGWQQLRHHSLKMNPDPIIAKYDSNHPVVELLRTVKRMYKQPSDNS